MKKDPLIEAAVALQPSPLVEAGFDREWETVIRGIDTLRKSAAGDSDSAVFMHMREACMNLRDGQVLDASRHLKGAADAAAKLAREIG